MSATNRTSGPSTNTFTAVFNAAEAEYQKITGKRLDTQPFAAKLDTCHSPENISNLLRTQAQAFSNFRQGDEKLMRWLGPTVNILFTFSDTFGEGIALVRDIIHWAWVFADVLFPAISRRENNLYWDRCPSGGRSLRNVHVGHLLIYNCQAVRDVVAKYDMLMHVFERTQLFL